MPKKIIMSVYSVDDSILLGADPTTNKKSSEHECVGMLDRLLERDKQRELDGFPKKIKVGRLVKPGKGGKDKIVVVPTTVEEKFIHDNRNKINEETGDCGQSGGSGDGQEGEVIGEAPLEDEEDESGEGGAGQGKGEEHEVESSAYDLGKILGEKFELPNLKDKGKKKAINKYTYDLTDRFRGSGQILDKKATLRKIVETNISLNNLDPNDIDPSKLLVSPKDKIYRILSRERDYESQAMIFFIRDYSGSMTGKPTSIVVSQHIFIYGWLLYQYERRVETRFILHDTEAKEVPDFYTYYNSRVAGGTNVSSGYALINKIVENEDLARDYNIYIFHGTDGDDWDNNGINTIPEIEKMLVYTNRFGITIVNDGVNSTVVERYIKHSGILDKYPKQIRVDNIEFDAPEMRLIEGIRKLLS